MSYNRRRRCDRSEVYSFEAIKFVSRANVSVPCFQFCYCTIICITMPCHSTDITKLNVENNDDDDDDDDDNNYDDTDGLDDYDDDDDDFDRDDDNSTCDCIFARPH